MHVGQWCHDSTVPLAGQKSHAKASGRDHLCASTMRCQSVGNPPVFAPEDADASVYAAIIPLLQGVAMPLSDIILLRTSSKSVLLRKLRHRVVQAVHSLDNGMEEAPLNTIDLTFFLCTTSILTKFIQECNKKDLFLLILNAEIIYHQLRNRP